jgi:hypothetical protein
MSKDRRTHTPEELAAARRQEILDAWERRASSLNTRAESESQRQCAPSQTQSDGRKKS